MISSKEVDNWFKKNQKLFYSYGSGGMDFWSYMRRIFDDDVISYSSFLYNASKGHGSTLGENFDCCLDNDLDNPSDFSHVYIFIGIDESELSISGFLELLKLTSDFYLEHYPNENEIILSYLAKINDRMELR